MVLQIAVAFLIDHSPRHVVTPFPFYSRAKAAPMTSNKLVETLTDEAAFLGMPVVVAPPGRTPVPAGEEAPVVTEGGGVRASVAAAPVGEASVGVEP
jgi:hypothetical protein